MPAVIHVPWTRHEPVTVHMGAKARVERDPDSEPLPVEGTIVGVRVKRREQIDIGQEAHYVILLLEPTGKGNAREFDLEEEVITYL